VNKDSLAIFVVIVAVAKCNEVAPVSNVQNVVRQLVVHNTNFNPCYIVEPILSLGEILSILVLIYEVDPMQKNDGD